MLDSGSMTKKTWFFVKKCVLEKLFGTHKNEKISHQNVRISKKLKGHTEKTKNKEKLHWEWNYILR